MRPREIPGLIVGTVLAAAMCASSIGWSVSNWLGRHGH